MNKVSICCLAYNHEPFIKQCLDGFIMQQTDFEFEVLIHDDASTDQTAKIIKEYENKYPSIIKPIYQKENQYSKGVSVTKTYNYPRAKGKYMALCEGDDYWTDPLKLQKQVDLMEKYSQASLCVALTSVYDEQTNTFREISPFSGPDYPLIYLDQIGHYFHTSSFLIRNNMLQEVNMKYPQLLKGDTPLRYLLMSKGPFVVLNDLVSVYRLSGEGVWTSISNFEKELWRYSWRRAFRKHFIREQRDLHLEVEIESLQQIIKYYKKEAKTSKIFFFATRYISLLLRYQPQRLLPYRIKKILN